ncbi:MAG: UDP-N-acetylglucosamine pyrophosphorylase [Deltaproteobacteria bacterium]|nr:UDP-N-acetylglucosamine pyrophosphorylase [Deltaproteobacteria bacterium]
MKKENTTGLSENIRRLMAKGVLIHNPLSIEIGNEVDPDRISGEDVIIHSGTRIYGKKTLISKGSRLGYESPVTVVDCQLGPHVELKGGFIKSSVFLEGSNLSSGALVREGCILEEQANAAHTVGLKQTLLFPFVTLGSLINFCDCFMAGGTSRKDHSEVGSSYIHFNYTPNQDKATPSLVGDVPRGVMLNQSPIFLGGQGGLVGPVRIGYGTVIAAGTVYRKDCPEGGKLLIEKNDAARDKTFHMGFYGDVTRRVYNNISYLANLLSLREWYVQIRQPFFRLQDMGEGLYMGMMDALESMIEERINRFRALSEKMEVSMALGEKIRYKKTILKQKKEFLENWPEIETCFKSGHETRIDQKNRDDFAGIIHHKINRGEKNYLQVIKSLDKRESAIGTQWLQNIVDDITRSSLNHLPSFRL